MSLVNDMLRDLEAKRGAGETDNNAVSRASGQPPQSGLQRPPARRTWAPAVVAFVVVVAAVLWRQQNVQPVVGEEALMSSASAVEGTQGQATSIVKAVAQGDGDRGAVNHPISNKEETPPAMTPVLDYYVPLDKQAEAVFSKQQTIETVDGAQIETLLLAARKALKRDRLTSPIDDNAYSRYQQVLVLEPGNEEAQQGLDTIADRYLRLAKEYASEGNIVRAKVLLRRASVVNPQSPQLQAFEQMLAQESAERVAEAKPAVAPGGSSNPTPAATSVQAVSVVKSAQWRDNDKVRQVRGLIERGDLVSAKLQLQAFLAAFPQAPESLKTLFHLYLQMADWQAAKALLAQADFLSAPTQAALTAHLLLAQDDLTAALQVLESQPVEYRQQVEFLSMLAGVYHKTGRYRDSASSYQQLLRLDGDKPAYWLGLAVALDALRDKPKALAAFKQAQRGRQSPAVDRYIAERISALSG